MRYKCKFCHRRSTENGRCARHQTAREVKPRLAGGASGPSRTRRRNRNAFRYGSAWVKTSARWLADNPWCVRCANKPAWLGERQFVPAVHVDHIVPVAAAPARAFDDTNFQSLCVSCHSSKTLRERKGECIDYVRGIIYVIDAYGLKGAPQ